MWGFVCKNGRRTGSGKVLWWAYIWLLDFPKGPIGGPSATSAYRRRPPPRRRRHLLQHLLRTTSAGSTTSSGTTTSAGPLGTSWRSIDLLQHLRCPPVYSDKHSAPISTPPHPPRHVLRCPPPPLPISSAPQLASTSSGPRFVTPKAHSIYQCIVYNSDRGPESGVVFLAARALQ
jgi:hypothetical protein